MGWLGGLGRLGGGWSWGWLGGWILRPAGVGWDGWDGWVGWVGWSLLVPALVRRRSLLHPAFTSYPSFPPQASLTERGVVT